MYEVTVDFGDNAVQAPKQLETVADLGLYLERIPGMMGFEINRQVTVKIETKWSRKNLRPLIPALDI